MRNQRSLSVALACLLAGGVVWAQVGRGGSEWLTAQGDAQRTSWVRADAAISPDSMSKPGFELQWTTKLDNQSRMPGGVFQGVTANGVTLFVPMSVVTGSSNNVYAIDNDTGYVVWQRHFDAPMPAPTAACAGGITAAATRIVSLTPPLPAPARGAGRGGAGYRSAVGQPGEGVPIEARGGGPGGAPAPGRAGSPQAAGVAPPAPPAAAQPGRGGAGAGAPGQGAATGRGQIANAGIPGAPDGGGPGGGYARPSGVAYAISSDGMLHVIGLQSGKDMQKPAAFLPANAQWSDAIAVNTTLYTATSQGCGGAPNAVWAIDLDSEAKPVVSWKTNGGNIVGSVAFTTDGTLLAAVGTGTPGAGGYVNAIVALEPKTLQIKDWFTLPAAEFVTGPMVIHHNDKDVVAAATKDGRILLLDTASLGGASHSTPMYSSAPLVAGGARFATEALASWQESTTTPSATAGTPPAVTLGTQWLLAPVSGRLSADFHAPVVNGPAATGSVIALKLVDAGGALSLQPGWVSNDLTSPGTPIIVNGVVFALSTGRAQTAGRPGTAATLHAYDGATGKALWNSQKAMTTSAAERSFWVAMGQTYVGTSDGTLYAFGFLDERR